MKRTYSKTPQNKEEPQPVISSRVGRLINGGGIKHAAVAAGNHFWVGTGGCARAPVTSSQLQVFRSQFPFKSLTFYISNLNDF